jgi:hypothetical protein
MTAEIAYPPRVSSVRLARCGKTSVRLLSVRLILSLILAITLVSLLSFYYQVQGEKRSLRADLGRRAAVLAERNAAASQGGEGTKHLSLGRKHYR